MSSSDQQELKESSDPDCGDHISQSGSTAEVIALAAGPGLSLSSVRKHRASSAARDKQACSRAQMNKLAGSRAKHD